LQSIILENYEMFQMIEKLKDTDLKIIMYLYEVKEAPIAWIVNGCKMSFGTVYRAIKILSDYKIIGERAEGNKRIIYLTDIGIKIAEHLLAIDKLLKSAQENPDN